MQNNIRALTLVLLAAVQLPLTAQKKVTYIDDVRPVLQRHCGNCHNSDRKRADLDVTSYNTLMAGSSSGEVVQSGEPGDSTLYLLVSHQIEPFMPPKQPRIPDKSLAILKAWIEGGLLETSGSKARAAKKTGANLALSAPVTGKPDGPPPMPGDVLLDPVVVTARAGTVNALAHSPWAPLVAIAGQKQVVLYDTSTLKLCGILPFPEGDPKSLRFSGNGRFLLVGGGKDANLGLAALYDITTGRRVLRVGAEPDAVLTADITSDQTLIVMGGPDRLVKVFSIATGEKIYQIKKHTDWVTAVGFSPDSVLMATGDRGGNLRVWESQDGARFYDLRGHRGAITAVAFRTDSNVLASASMDGTVKLWDMHTGRQIRSFSAHGGGVFDVHFAMNGSLVTAGRDRRVKTWDANGRSKRQFDPFGESALSAVFDHESKRVVGADWTGAVRVWNAEDGKKLGDLVSNPEPLTAQIVRLTDLVSGPDLSARMSALRHATAASAKASASELAPIKKRKQRLDATVTARTKLISDLTKTLDNNRKAAADARARVPKVKAEISKLDADVIAKDKARGESKAAEKAAAKGLAARRALVNTQKQAAVTAKSLASAAKSNQDLAHAAKVAKDAVHSAERAAATAQAHHGKTVATRDATRKAATATKTARGGKRAELAKLERAIKQSDAVVAKSILAREKARAEFIAAKAGADAIAAPLAALEKVAATVQHQADEAARLADEVGSISTQLKRLRAAQVFTRLYYTRDELDAAALLVDRRRSDLAGARASRLEAEKDLLESEKALEATHQALAAATQTAGVADAGLTTTEAAVDKATRAMEVRTAADKAARERTAEAKLAREAGKEQVADADRTVATAHAAIDDARQRISQRQSEVAGARRTLAFHDSDVARATERIREQDAAARAVQRELAAIDAATRAIDEHTDAIALARQLGATLDKERASAEQALTEMDKERRAADEARSGNDRALAERREAHARATAEYTRLRNTFDRQASDRARIGRDLEFVSSKLARARNDGQEQRIRELAREVGSLTGRSLRLLMESARSKAQVRDAAAARDTLTREIESLGTARDAAAADADEAEAERRRLTADIASLRSKSAVAVSEAERLASRSMPAGLGRAERLERRPALLARARRAASERTARRAHAEQLSIGRAAPREALDGAGNALATAEEALARRIADHNRALASASGQKSEHAALVKAVATAEQAATRTIADVAAAQRSFDSAREAAEVASAVRDAAHQVAAKARRLSDDAPGVVAEKNAAAQDARDAVGDAEGLLDEARAKLKGLEAQVAELKSAYDKARN